MGLGATDINLLVALEALLEEANVTRAGARLGLSQSTVSGTLSKLRRHYHDALLVRVGRDYELTPLAKSLLPAVQEGARSVRCALRLVADFDPTTSERSFTLVASDYALTVLHAPLHRRLRALAPAVQLELADPPQDILASDRALLRYDFMIGPLGSAFPGDHELLFADRLVCIVDAGNPRLVHGRLSMRDLAELPHANATFSGAAVTPVDRLFDALDVPRRVLARVHGFLPLPFVIRGTEAVAVVPERLARRFADGAGLAVVEPPFGRLDMLEGLWWHPSRTADPAHHWLLSVLRSVAAELAENAPAGSMAPAGGMRHGGLPETVDAPEGCARTRADANHVVPTRE